MKSVSRPNGLICSRREDWLAVRDLCLEAVLSSIQPPDEEATMSEPVKTGKTGDIDDAVCRYRDEIGSEHRPVFDRIHRLILVTCPDAEVTLSYGMPTYRIGRRRNPV
jgi:hypothetical protein